MTPLAAALDASTVLALVMATVLIWPRRLQVNRRDDLRACAGLATLAATYIGALLVPILFPEFTVSRSGALAPFGELAAAIAMFAVMKSPADRLLVPGGGPRAVSVLTVIAVVVAAVVRVLPVDQRSTWGSTKLAAGLGATGASGSLLMTVTVAVAGGLIAWSAYRIRFAGRGARGDGATAWLSLGLTLIALSAITRLFPASFLTGGIPLGDALRTCAAAVILVAVMRRESVLRQQAARRAALAERQRVARDLHDGVAQDLAFIAAHGARAGELGEAMATAARRALALTRGVIDDLSDLSDASLLEALMAVAQEMEDRFGISVTVEAGGAAAVPLDISADLLRIVREAIANAARHGAAANVLVVVEQTETHLLLRVRDDGCGIDLGPDGRTTFGFGLNSMSERAASTGGQLSVSDVESGGMELAVAWH